MREIKFRGKNIGTNEWVYGYFGEKLNVETEEIDSYIITPTYTPSTDSSYFTDNQVVHETVGQYTGLKDKKGVEIYERDITINRYGTTSVVEYHNFGFRLDNGFLKTPLYKFNSNDKLEVIGNIYDNPELLENL